MSTIRHPYWTKYWTQLYWTQRIGVKHFTHVNCRWLCTNSGCRIYFTWSGLV